MHILIGFIIFAVGAFIVIKSEAMLNAFGRIEFFERHLSSDGGSRIGYKLIGILAIFIGILVMTNMIGGFLEWILSPILRYNQSISMGR
ncbi:hypothetical protein KKA93_00185 [Patescibacteria group bacterium]|nr:hypothetical protein [Patescibacteria group bacterium]MBU1663455.1 hypothetical protein [Patescibacteria group bacterium]MBU1934214.1 hypothetical protein [Patescibacteria group bacterium]MBU2007679.1 hypothetical protein [Patescibacteria group bacterium]MBU2233509.1 hypothetical protein [Patescibacteria group bacterium]